jgi:carbonic anhydrase/acetyltransferase-like protein (isoleucine patch superfamily)
MMGAEIKEIAKSAILKDVEIKAKKLVISEGAQLEKVRVESDSFFVGKNTKINNSILLSNGSIDIGNLVQIKENSVLKAFKAVKVGDRTIIDRGVIVGGLQSEHSYFEIGNRCVILHHTYINTAREIIIGNNVGIGGYCIIFSHGVWQNAFKGYPFQFGKVEIKDDAWLPWHVFVMPNVTIGKGTTIAGGSVVTKDIPDYCLAGGVPAKVIAQENYPPKMGINAKNKLAKIILHDFEGYFKNFVGNKSVRVKELSDGIILFISDVGNMAYFKKAQPTLLERPELSSLDSFDIISFQVPLILKQKFSWIEIDSETRSKKVNVLLKEFVQFVNRYGLRIVDENLES